MLYERVHRDLFFDANDNPDGASEDIVDYGSNVKRCLKCNKKVKIVEQAESEE